MEVKGTIERISNTVQVSDNFQKREFVIKHGENIDYPEYSSLEFIKDKCDVLDKFNEGQEVEVEFNLKGRGWNDTKTGETKYFNTLQAWKINATGNTVSTPTPKYKVTNLATAGGDNNLDLPF